MQTLRAYVAAECAGDESAVEELADQFGRCVESARSANKLSIKDSIVLSATIGRGFRDLTTMVDKVETTSVASPSGGAGIPFESMLINTVTDFVVARAKAEVLGWVADEFGKRLCDERDDAGVNVASYFEHTCRLFRKEGEIAATVADFGRSLQVAVQRDLRASIGRLVNGASAHLDPRLRVLATFVAELIETRKLATAVADVDRQVACQGDRVICFMKLGLHVLALFEQNELDPGKPEELIKALDAAIARSPDEALKGSWRSWSAALSKATTMFVLAKKAATDVRTALSNPASDTLAAADTAIVSFLLAVEAEAPLSTEDKAMLRSVAEKVTLTREWLAVALAAYQVIDGIRRGDDPVGLVVAAGRTLPCREGRDVVCAVKAGLVALDAVTSTPGWNTLALADVTAVHTFVSNAADAYGQKIAALGDHTPAWVRKHLPLPAGDKLTLVQSVLLQARRMTELVRATYATRDERPLTHDEVQVLWREVLASTRSLFAVANVLTERYATGITPANVTKAQQVIDDLFGAWMALEDGDAGQFVVALLAAADGLGVANALPASMRRYLPLVTSIASAQDSEQMRAALEKYAAPVGGYKEKRKRSWMASVTALVGGAVGREKLDTPMDSSSHGHAGLFAPIGIDVACGHGHWCNGFGVMLSVLDVGNLVSVRLDDIDAPDPSFEQVFSPGVYVRWNALGPANVGFGLAAVPAMRRPEPMSSNDPEPDAVGGFKAVAFIAADVTLFPF